MNNEKKPRWNSTIAIGVAVVFITVSILILGYWATVLPGRTATVPLPPGYTENE